MVKQFISLVFFLVVGVLLAWYSPAQAQTVTVHVSNNKIDQDTGLTVEFRVTGGPVAEPDWTPITRDFNILSRNQMQAVQIVNGKQTSRFTWKLELMPKRAGTLIIPAMKFGALLSQQKAIQVKVRKPPPQSAAARPDIYLRATINPTNIYVQQQVILTLKVFMAKPVNGNITPPKANLQTIVEALGEAKNYQVNQKGKVYKVYERRYLLFPQASGDMVIEPGHLTGNYVEKRRRIGVNKNSPPVKAKVLAVPKQFSGNFWAPAQAVSLKQQWSGDIKQWEQGKPLTRTIDLSAAGLLPSQLPEVPTYEMRRFNVYAEPNPSMKKNFTNSGVVGARQQKFVFIPRREGEYKMPAIKIPWWNTKSNRAEYAELPAVTVRVVAEKSGLIEDEEKTLDDSIITEMPPIESDGVVSILSDVEAAGFWFWLSMGFASGWLLTLLLLLRRQQTVQALARVVVHRMTQRVDLRKALKHLRAACITEDPVAVREALLQWGSVIWQNSPPQTLGQLACFCSEELAAHIKRLDQAIYGKSKWRRADLLWQAIERESPKMMVAKVAREKLAAVKGLEPLHRLN